MDNTEKYKITCNTYRKTQALWMERNKMQTQNSPGQSSNKRFYSEKVLKLIRKQESENGGRQKLLSKPRKELEWDTSKARCHHRGMQRFQTEDGAFWEEEYELHLLVSKFNCQESEKHLGVTAGILSEMFCSDKKIVRKEKEWNREAILKLFFITPT